MLHLRGRWPVPNRFIVPAVLLGLSLPGLNAPAAQQRPLTLAEAERLALAAEPGVEALGARADAMDEASVAAGELPDPALRVGLANYPVESGGFTTEGMTQAQIGIRQSFTPRARRDASTRRLESLSRALRQDAANRERDVLTAVRQAWIDAWYWSRAAATIRASRPFFEEMLSVTRSLYSVGRNKQQDLLRAELELSRIDDRLLDIERQSRRAAEALAEWVGAEAGRPPAEAIPDWPILPPLDELQAGLARHPALLATAADIDAREAGVAEAEAGYRPGWALDLGYGHRNGVLATGIPRSDFVSLMVTFDLPVFRDDRQDRQMAAALAERRAARSEAERVMRSYRSRLRVEYAHWETLDRRVGHYESSILPQTADYAAATLLSYRNDTGSFEEVARARVAELDAAVELLRLEADRASSFAVLANLGGLAR